MAKLRVSMGSRFSNLNENRQTGEVWTETTGKYAERFSLSSPTVFQTQKIEPPHTP